MLAYVDNVSEIMRISSIEPLMDYVDVTKTQVKGLRGLVSSRRSYSYLVNKRDKLRDLILKFSHQENKDNAIKLLAQKLESRLKKESLARNAIRICLEQHLPLLLLESMKHVGFEARKEVVNLFIKCTEAFTGCKDAELYMIEHGDAILDTILECFTREELVLHAGVVFRRILAVHQCLHGKILSKFEQILDCFKPWLLSHIFDVALDTFCSLTNLLQTIPSIEPTFFQKNYLVLAGYIQDLLCSDQYMAQRQSLNLLRVVLFERVNYHFMNRYINEKDKLITIMKLLADTSLPVRIGAYHIFKFFAANPEKNPEVQRILLRNRQKLINLLNEHLKLNDADLECEKQAIIRDL